MNKISNKDNTILYSWNWGAFLLAPVWSLFYRIYWGILTWTPYLVMAIATILIKTSAFGIIGKNICLHILVYLQPLSIIIYIISSFVLGITGNASFYNSLAIEEKDRFIIFKANQQYWLIMGIFLFPAFFISIIVFSWRLTDLAYYESNM